MTSPFRPLSLAPCLSLPEQGVVTVYGAGGKTSVMETLTRELTKQGKRVIQTTTTKIFRPDNLPTIIGEDLAVVTEGLLAALREHPAVALGATLLTDNKLSGIDPAWPAALLEQKIADYIIVEADGSARKPIKGYASYEPVFPTRSDILIPVLGIDAIGRPVNPENVHRSEAFCQLTGAKPDAPLEFSHFLTSLRHMIDLGHASTPQATVIPVINKIDKISGYGVIREITEGLQRAGVCLLFTSLKDENSVWFVYQGGVGGNGFGISVVVLAAGGSVRMGKSKLSLEIKGKTLLEHALGPIREAGFKDVVVVFSEENEKLRALVPRNYRVVINRHSQEGISTSLKAGVAAVDPRNQGILFALGDQPFVGVDVYQKLVQYHRRHLTVLTWPVHEGKRGNPVLFDRRLWPELMKVEGDEGGKQIITRTSPEDIGRVEVAEAGVLIDIDTPDEYEKYRGKEQL
jgi:molybdenum cofactor cytidylyltransferase